MKKIITLVLLFHVVVASGQSYYPLLRSNVFWDVFTYDGTQICNLSGASRYLVEGDTLINGTYYKIIKGHPIISLLPQPSPFCSPFGVNGNSAFLASYFMREDTSLQQVFVFDHVNNQEDLLYDFSLQVGDTINSNYVGQGSPFVVDSIGNYLMPDGTSRRIFYGMVSWSVEFYIEGVGSSTGLFHPLMEGIGFAYRLSCVLENNISIYNDSLNQFGCLNFVGLNEIQFQSVLKVYPNPAKDKLIFNLEIDSTSELRLFDATCRLIHLQSIDKGSTEIQIKSFENGIYFYQVQSQDNLLLHGKIIVEN